jgi:hypothetical protein
VKNNILLADHRADVFGGEPSEISDNLVDGISAALDREHWRLT